MASNTLFFWRWHRVELFITAVCSEHEYSACCYKIFTYKAFNMECELLNHTIFVQIDNSTHIQLWLYLGGWLGESQSCRGLR